MNTEFDYYYNNVPGKGLCRNNLIYTSLISKDRKTFCKWYYNDTDYHQNQNEIIDVELMNEKWNREIKFLHKIVKYDKELMPEIETIDHINKKIYFHVDGVDFWETAGCDQKNFDDVLPDWQDQMINHLIEYRKAGIWKYSLHPSSYFVISGKLKAINFFFCYDNCESKQTIRNILSHVSKNRRKNLFNQMKLYNMNIDQENDFNSYAQLCLDSFLSDYPANFIEKAKKIYV
jgi:hypothetical protein